MALAISFFPLYLSCKPDLPPPLPSPLSVEGAFCFLLFFKAAWAFAVFALVFACVALVFFSRSAVCLAVVSSLMPKNFFTHSHAFFITALAFSNALTRKSHTAEAIFFTAAHTASQILRKVSQLLYAAINAPTSAAIAITTIPMGLALSTKFRAICATFQMLDATATTFAAAACASVATFTAFSPATTVLMPPLSCTILMRAMPLLAIHST